MPPYIRRLSLLTAALAALVAAIAAPAAALAAPAAPAGPTLPAPKESSSILAWFRAQKNPADASNPEAQKSDALKPEPPKPEAPKPEPLKPEPPKPQPEAEPGMVGYDISWPQCPPGMPMETPMDRPPFAVVGVTGGKAYTENRCFDDVFRWAASSGVEAQLYTNLNGMPNDYQDDHCAPDDRGCAAYWYGFGAAREAIDYARGHGADVPKWWLDVEIENWWSPDKFLNEQVVHGAIDFLQSVHKDVGIYSTPFQFHEITGDYQPRLPVWTAGASNFDDAQRRCGNPRYEFGGGQVELVQWIDGKFDNNLAC